MLSAMNRLHKMVEFQNVFKNSKPIFSGFLSVRACQRKGLAQGESRFGIVVSNKFDKRATRRNSMKRQIRHIIREMLPDIKPGHDIVIFAKGSVPFPYSQEEIRTVMADLLAKAEVVNYKHK